MSKCLVIMCMHLIQDTMSKYSGIVAWIKTVPFNDEFMIL